MHFHGVGEELPPPGQVRGRGDGNPSCLLSVWFAAHWDQLGIKKVDRKSTLHPLMSTLHQLWREFKDWSREAAGAGGGGGRALYPPTGAALVGLHLPV